jgi:hypothetical protein
MEAVRWPRRKWQSQKGEDKGKKGECHPHLLRRLWLPACSSLFFLSGGICSAHSHNSHLPLPVSFTKPPVSLIPKLHFTFVSLSCSVNQHPSNASLLSISILVGRHPERKMTRRNGTEREIKKYI